MERRQRTRQRSRRNRLKGRCIETSTDAPESPKLPEPPGSPDPPSYKFALEKGISNSESTETNPTDNGKLIKDSQPTCKYSPDELRRARALIPRIQQYRRGKLSERPKTNYNYALWRDAYDSYLWVLFDGFINVLNSFKVELDRKIEFNDFALFVYFNSSGYITPYA